MGQLTNKTALITGAGSGIGKAAAILFAREGARIGALSRTEDELQETIKQIKDDGGQTLAEFEAALREIRG